MGSLGKTDLFTIFQFVFFPIVNYILCFPLPSTKRKYMNEVL